MRHLRRAGQSANQGAPVKMTVQNRRSVPHNQMPQSPDGAQQGRGPGMPQAMVNNAVAQLRGQGVRRVQGQNPVRHVWQRMDAFKHDALGPAPPK